MNRKEHYLHLRDLLMPWRDVWGYSVLKAWEDMRACLGDDGLRSLSRLGLEGQYQFLLGHTLRDLPPVFHDFHRELTRWSQLPQTPRAEALRPPYDEGLTPKKNHEIASILAYFRKECPSWEQIVDIGGGAGHLARHLAVGWKVPTVSIDREGLFQKEGLRLLQRRPWKVLIQAPFRFVTGTFPGCLGDEHIFGESPTLSVGLHTCGPLAWAHLSLSSPKIEVLNFGCCYDKLHLETDVERSQWAQKNSLSWTHEALFLVTRGGKERGLEEFAFQARVQNYRFALHHLLKEEFGREEFVSVGQTASRQYQGSFAHYARERLQVLDIPCPLSDLALDSFRAERALLLEEQWMAALLRNRLARPLEIILLLDRVLWLEEQGFEGELFEFFDPRLSPRNVGIHVRPRSSSA